MDSTLNVSNDKPINLYKTDPRGQTGKRTAKWITGNASIH